MTRQNKRTLLILSDLFPVDQSPWIYSYVKELEPYFNIHIYDSQQLGGYNTTRLKSRSDS